MSDAFVMFPASDIEGSVAAATKLALMNLPQFQIAMPAFTATPVNNILKFPNVGVDFRTVQVQGTAVPFVPKVFTPDGMVAELAFTQPQTAPVTVEPYTRYSTYFLGSVDDLPFDLYAFAGDVNAANKQIRTVPIAMPVIKDYKVQRYSGRGETVRIYGYFCLYGGAAQGGLQVVKTESGKLYAAIRGNLQNFTQSGITQLVIDPPKFSVYQKDTVLYEGSMSFSCVVRIA